MSAFPRPETSALPLNTARTLVPLSLEFPADLETPVSAYIKLAAGEPGFLLESVERDESAGRFSFIGLGPFERLELRGDSIEHRVEGRSQATGLDGLDPLEYLRELLAARRLSPDAPRLPLFGGAVGYFAYDMARRFERLGDGPPDTQGLPEALLLLPSTIVVFDHVRRSMRIVASIDESRSGSREAAEVRLDELRQRLASPLDSRKLGRPVARGSEPQSNQTREQFEDKVRRAQEYIRAGEIFQVVLSQRLSGETAASPLQIYRALRSVNPSPYMFYLDFGELKLIGSSPEELVKLEGRQASLRPIAGTRPRSSDAAEDAALEAELIASEKERAEHVMLVDLGRNDLGRVCRVASVKVEEQMKVERYSHVMHLVSRVTGELAEDRDKFDLLRAAFPAGTLSGAPKIRAMQIIDELEPERRGPYGGAVGYLGLNGQMDTCITIRTIVMQGGRYALQAGAGIVYDSDPAAEYEETLHKMAALREAIRLAEEGF